MCGGLKPTMKGGQVLGPKPAGFIMQERCLPVRFWTSSFIFLTRYAGSLSGTCNGRLDHLGTPECKCVSNIRHPSHLTALITWTLTGLECANRSGETPQSPINGCPWEKFVNHVASAMVCLEETWPLSRWPCIICLSSNGSSASTLI